MSDFLQNNGIESVFGPNWDADVETICAAVASIDGACEALRATPIATEDNPHGAKEAGVKQVEHFGQNYFVD